MDNSANGKNSLVLLKVLRILDCFSINEPLLSSKEIGQKTGINSSSLYRYIAMLCEFDLLEKDSFTGKYTIGMHAVQLGGIRLACIDALRLGSKNMDRLSEEVRLNVNMAILYKGDSLHIHYVICTDVSRGYPVIGRRTPAHMTALGKVIYAQMPREQVHGIIETYGWRPARTPKSIRDFSSLDADLDETQRRGYAIDDGENSVSGYCIAAPIFRQNREVVAAVSITGAIDVMEKKSAQYAESVVKCARDISYKLGYYD